MNSPQDQQRLSSFTQKENTEDDYLQILDAGEEMYGMFVENDQDIFEYLIYDQDVENSNEDIEDIISRSLVPSDMDDPGALNGQSVDGCCASFSDMVIHGKGVSDVGMDSCNGNGSINEIPNTGRLTPDRNDEDDVMSQWRRYYIGRIPKWIE